MITQTSIHAYYSVLLTEGTSVLWIAITVLDLLHIYKYTH